MINVYKSTLLQAGKEEQRLIFESDLLPSLQAMVSSYADSANVAALEAAADILGVNVDKKLTASLDKVGGNTYSQYVNAARAIYDSDPTEKTLKQFLIEMQAIIGMFVRDGGNKGWLEAGRQTNGVRYARILSGKGDSCAFCIMLAGRGFVYWNKEAASHAHLNCKCITVCSNQYNVVDGHREYYLPGYNPKPYEKIYEDAVMYDKAGHVNLYGTLNNIRRKYNLWGHGKRAARTAANKAAIN